MKKLEYKAWDKVDEKMVKVTAVNFRDLEGNIKTDVLTIRTQEENGRFYETIIEDVILLPFIGLKDKKKKKIFEGDILLIKTWLGFIKTIAPVEFDRGAFRVAGEPVSNWDDVEVIGNIYENSELLEGKQ